MRSGALAAAGPGVSWRVRSCLWLGLGVAAVASACSAGGGEPPPGNARGGSGNVGVGGATVAGNGPGSGGSSVTSGGAQQTGAGGAPSSGGAVTVNNGGSVTTNGGAAPGAGGAAPGAGGMACQTAETKFEPKIPTVYVMVDRSGSMFDCLSTTNPEPSCGASNMMQDKNDTAWVKLRTATLQVIESLQAEVRFGFASFTGTNPASSGKCPMIDKVAPNFNNHTAISTLYNSLAFQPETTESGKKFETPARESLDLIGAELMADATPGDKFILFVTDGQPDYCDDSNTLCAPDSVVAGLQALKAKGITTIVMGIKSNIQDLAPNILQSFANAGMGEPTMAPLKTATQQPTAFYDECKNIAGWARDLVASGKPDERGTTLGTYSAESGPTKARTPNAADQAELLKELTSALSGVKSCTFDLSNVNGKSIKVDLNQLAAAEVKIESVKVPLDMTNGWGMANATQLVLTGTACDTWRKPETDDIAFNFPCDTIIFE